MAGKVKLNKDNVAKGTPVEVQGLGSFPNGKTSTVSEATWRRFLAENPDFPEDYTFEISTTSAPPGPTQGTGTAEPQLNVDSMNKEELKTEAERRGIEVGDKTAAQLRTELSS